MNTLNVKIGAYLIYEICLLYILKILLLLQGDFTHITKVGLANALMMLDLWVGCWLKWVVGAVAHPNCTKGYVLIWEEHAAIRLQVIRVVVVEPHEFVTP